MYRIDKFLEYYQSLSGSDMEIEKGIWVHSKPIPFYNGFLTKEYWKNLKDRLKGSFAVLRGKADAVTWEK